MKAQWEQMSPNMKRGLSVASIAGGLILMVMVFVRFEAQKGKFRKNDVCNAGVHQKRQSDSRVVTHHDLRELLADPLS